MAKMMEMEKENSLSFEQQEKLDRFLEEIRPTVEAFIFDRLNESDYSYEMGQMIGKFREQNKDILITQITERKKEIENEIEQLKLEQLKL